MKILLSVNLAFSALLATVMLQMGDEQSSMFVCVLSFIVILAGLILVDVQERFALTDGWANVVILAVVAAHLGVLLRSPTEFLAYSIANILVYVQMVLFFKKKETRVCFQLTTLSFLQVCVACVSEQGIFFAFTLLIYCFSIVCVLTLLFLVKEQEYYEKHAFIRPAFGTEGPQGPQGIRHLLVLALKAFFLTPIYILFGTQTDEYEVFLRQESSRSLPKFQFRSLGAGLKKLFTNPQQVLHDFKTIWGTPRKKNQSIRVPLPSIQTNDGDRLFGFWEQASTDLDSKGPHHEEFASLSANTSLNDPSQPVRFPLLYTRPVFSGANRSGERMFLSRGLVRQLLFHSFLALVFAVIVFVLFPRFQKLEFGDLRFGHDGWNSSRKQPTAAVGFSERIQLGDLGPSADNHEVVLTLAFTDMLKGGEAQVKSGTPVYLRGVSLIRYQARQWSRVSRQSEHVDDEHRSRRPLFISNNAPFSSRDYHMGAVFPDDPERWANGMFDPGNDLFRENVRLVPFNSPIVFTVWPFFRIEGKRNGGFFDENWFVRSINESFRHTEFDLYVNAFRDSRQVDLVPNQENLDGILDAMLEVDEELLPRLCEKARQWDENSGLKKEDIIGRAKYLERQLRDENGFAYTRYNVLRDRQLDPLEDFVVSQPRGHCEYFAGALTMMLRAVGISSRIVIGFKVNVDYSELGDRCIVRQSDAHSWVEAFIPPESIQSGKGTGVMFPTDPEGQSQWWSNGAWLRLDATPSYDAALFTNIAKNYHVWLAMCQNFWNTYVLNYNDGRQHNLVYKPAAKMFRSIWEEVSKHQFGFGLVPVFLRNTATFFRNLFRGQWSTVDFIFGVVPLAFVALLTWLAIRFFHRYMVRVRRERKDQSESIRSRAAFYLRLEKYFARAGITRLIWETPREFILRCANDEQFFQFLSNDLAILLTASDVELSGDRLKEIFVQTQADIITHAGDIVDAYYCVRYGNKSLSPEEFDHLDSLLDRINLPWDYPELK